MENIPEKEAVTLADLDEILKKASVYMEELKEPLKDIKVPVKKSNEDILNAINNLFGDSYISSEGESMITFPMYLQCLELIRSVGGNTAASFV